MSRAACLHANPVLFFPAMQDHAGQLQAERAKAICARCPVRGECLAYALATRQKYGIWGGATAEERRTMTRRDHMASQPGSRRHSVGL
jgi:WhiB family redox-sensing transcriptional regulator